MGALVEFVRACPFSIVLFRYAVYIRLEIVTLCAEGGQFLFELPDAGIRRIGFLGESPVVLAQPFEVLGLRLPALLEFVRPASLSDTFLRCVVYAGLEIVTLRPEGCQFVFELLVTSVRRLGLLGEGLVVLAQRLERVGRLRELSAHFIAFTRHAFDAGFSVVALGDGFVQLVLKLLCQGAGRNGLSCGGLAFFREGLELRSQLVICLLDLATLFLYGVAFV